MTDELIPDDMYSTGNSKKLSDSTNTNTNDLRGRGRSRGGKSRGGLSPEFEENNSLPLDSQNNSLQLLESIPESPEKEKCNIEEVSKGRIVEYRSPLPGTPGTISGTDIIVDRLERILTELKHHEELFNTIELSLTTKSPTESWFELQTTSSVATPPNAVNPNQDPNNLTNGIIPGYDEVEVNKNLKGRNAEKLWIVNDGLVPIGNNTGSDMFLITSTNGMSFSPEFRLAFGEVRIVNDVYSFRFRCPVAGNFIRASEREIQPPYIQSIIVTGGTAVATTANRPTFVTHQISAPFGGICLTGGPAPSFPIPNGFAVALKSDVDNASTNRIYVAVSAANVTNPTNRFTLGPGEGVSLYVTDANIIFIGSNGIGPANVDWIMEG